MRRVEPGATYLITKKTNDDRYLIRPSDTVNAVLLYVMILKAERHGISIHAYCFMSNHFHLVLTDVQGKLPEFMGEFLTDTSKALQTHFGDRRRIWSGERYNDVKLLDLDAAEREIVYTHLNPTRAGATLPEEWPGLTSVGLESGAEISAERPAFYFSERYRPKNVDLQLAPVARSFAEDAPVDLDAWSNDSAARIREQHDAELSEIQREFRAEKKSLRGPRKVLAVPREYRRPPQAKLEPKITPRFASKNRELLECAVTELREFELAHREAKERYTAGRTRTVFPRGTYGYHRRLGVRVAA